HPRRETRRDDPRAARRGLWRSSPVVVGLRDRTRAEEERRYRHRANQDRVRTDAREGGRQRGDADEDPERQLAQILVIRPENMNGDPKRVALRDGDVDREAVGFFAVGRRELDHVRAWRAEFYTRRTGCRV